MFSGSVVMFKKAMGKEKVRQSKFEDNNVFLEYWVVLGCERHTCVGSE